MEHSQSLLHINVFMFKGYPIEVGCYDGDLGYTDMWSVDLGRWSDEYSTYGFEITECFRDCDRRPFIGVVSTNTEYNLLQ